MLRRNFLKAGAAASVGTAAWANGLAAQAQASGKTLVVIFQRGGCDGLSVVVPHGEDEYYNLRPSIAIPRPGRTNGALDIDGFFGLHPSLAGLKPILDSGHMAFMPTVQYPDPDRSHFESMQFIEQAVPNAELSTGWLNRYMSDQPSTGGLRGATFDSDLDKSMRGSADAVTINDLRNFNLDVGGEEEVSLVRRLRSIYGETPTPDTAYGRLTHDSGSLALEYLQIVQPIDADSYTPENGASYPDSSYGRRLRQIAQLIKSGVGLEVATTSLGGWDTHEDQGTSGDDDGLARNLQHFGDGIAAMYTDLGTTRMQDTLILTMTEFGRSAEENGSGGTDHGEASTWLAINASSSFVPGLHGTWPGLNEEQLSRERYLQWTVDYRDIMGDILRGHLGAPGLEASLPGHTWQPLGLFNSLS